MKMIELEILNQTQIIGNSSQEFSAELTDTFAFRSKYYEFEETNLI